ncbi:MAG: sugar transferase [Lachnospiraceae bacterium]|nr:sugar transferase [Lachnospiraceae bacterium]
MIDTEAGTVDGNLAEKNIAKPGDHIQVKSAKTKDTANMANTVDTENAAGDRANKSSKTLGKKASDTGLSYAEIAEGKSLWYRFWKRFFDIVLCCVAMIPLSIVFAIVSILVAKEDGRPIFFVQERNGLNGKVFRMYKFRSMCKNAPELHKELIKENELDGPAFKMKDDPRITKIGKFIRKTSIDELPQLINIIKGDMSIVGPRPLPTYETAECNEYQNQRLLVKPGLTCYWQCSGRNDIEFDEWIEMDLKYIKEASLWTDIKIILMTVKAVLLGDGAY